MYYILSKENRFCGLVWCQKSFTVTEVQARGDRKLEKRLLYIPSYSLLCLENILASYVYMTPFHVKGGERENGASDDTPHHVLAVVDRA